VIRGQTTPQFHQKRVRAIIAREFARRVSGGTRSADGRDCRDAFLALMRTAAKLGIAFWHYLGHRLGIPGQPAVPYLPDLIRSRAQPT
jgi:hypothetical protein